MKVINSLPLIFLLFVLIRDTLLTSLIIKSNEISYSVSTILTCNYVLLSLDMTQLYLYGRSNNLDLASDLQKLPAYAIVSQERILRDSY